MATEGCLGIGFLKGCKLRVCPCSTRRYYTVYMCTCVHVDHEVDSMSIKKRSTWNWEVKNSGSMEDELEMKEYQVDLTQYVYEHKIKKNCLKSKNRKKIYEEQVINNEKS